jgi:hypothetical protein
MTNFLTTISKSVAVLSFAVLWLGFSYEYGFFNLIGRPLQGLMKAADYISGAIMWLPAVTLAFAVGVGAHFVLRRLENFRPESEIKAGYPTRRAAWISRDLPNTLTAGSIVFVGFFDLMFGNPYVSLVPFALSIVWFLLCKWYFADSALKDFSRLAFLFIIVAPVFTLIAFWHGLTDGYRALSEIDKVYFVKLVDDEAEKKMQLLRNLDQGLLLRDPVSSKIVFYNWDNVSAFSFVSEVPAQETLFCKLTGYNCKFIPQFP